MNEPIKSQKRQLNPQIIQQNGQPAFAVLPWDEYRRLIKAAKTYAPYESKDLEEPDVWFPHEVVKTNVIEGKSLIKAWREFLNLTQQQLADRANLPQSSIARMETSDKLPRTATLKKLANAMNITVEQLKD